MNVFPNCNDPVVFDHHCSGRIFLECTRYRLCKILRTRRFVWDYYRLANYNLGLLDNMLEFFWGYWDAYSKRTVSVDNCINILPLVVVFLCKLSSMLGLIFPNTLLVFRCTLMRWFECILYLEIPDGVIHIHLFPNLMLWLPDMEVVRPIQ